METMKLPLVAISIIALLTCSACSSPQVKGKSPFVSVSSMILGDDGLSTRFDIRNINDVEMTIDAIDIMLRMRDAELTRYDRGVRLTIGPNTTEDVTVEQVPDEPGRELLRSLASGDESSLPISLDGRVHTVEDGFMSFRHEGYLYPVPGRPGHFRSATTSVRRER